MELKRCHADLDFQKDSFREVNAMAVSLTMEKHALKFRNDALAGEVAAARDLLAQKDGIEAELELERGIVRELGIRVGDLVEECDQFRRELVVAAGQLKEPLQVLASF
jgi:hypothetical protein